MTRRLALVTACLLAAFWVVAGWFDREVGAQAPQAGAPRFQSGIDLIEVAVLGYVLRLVMRAPPFEIVD
jgi:hypothetical protein